MVSLRQVASFFIDTRHHAVTAPNLVHAINAKYCSSTHGTNQNTVLSHKYNMHFILIAIVLNQGTFLETSALCPLFLAATLSRQDFNSASNKRMTVKMMATRGTNNFILVPNNGGGLVFLTYESFLLC